MAVYAVIKNNVVINTIIWDGNSNWAPPEDCELIETIELGIGYTYDEELKKWVAPIIEIEDEEQLQGE